MTTRISIKHEGGPHKDVRITAGNGEYQVVTRLSEGESHEEHVYPGRSILVEEIDRATGDTPAVPT